MEHESPGRAAPGEPDLQADGGKPEARMSWSRHFSTPIKTPDCKTLRALQHAAEYVLALPPKV